MPQRPWKCKSPAFILVHSIAREPKQEIADSSANRGSQQQVLGLASRSGNFFWDLSGTPGGSLEIKMQTSSLEKVCWGGFLLVRGFTLGCCGEAAKACQLWDCYPLLLFHGGTNDVRGDLEDIKNDCMDPVVVAKGTGAKAVSPQSRQ